MCSKITYQTKSEARKDAKVIFAGQKHFSRRHTRKPTAKMRVYQCRRCDLFHLTSGPVR